MGIQEGRQKMWQNKYAWPESRSSSQTVKSVLPAVVKNAAKPTERFTVDSSASAQKGEVGLRSLEQTEVLSAKQSKSQHLVII